MKNGVGHLGLVVLGALAALGVLEGSLRIAHVWQTQTDESSTPLILPRANEIRILCLGESTTWGIGQNNWPSKLAKRLERSAGVDVKIINAGVPAVYSAALADNIEERLDYIQPHIVITMLGINDDYNLLVHKRPNEMSWWWKSFRVIRLFRGLLAGVLGRFQKQTLHQSDEIATLLRGVPETVVTPEPEPHGPIAPFIPAPVVEGYSANLSPAEQLRILRGVPQQLADNISVLVRLEQLYSQIGDTESLIPILRKLADSSAPVVNVEAARRLAVILRDGKADHEGAMRALRRVIELDQNASCAMYELAVLLRGSDRCSAEAAQLLTKACALVPMCAIVPIALHDLLRDCGRQSEAEEYLQRGEKRLREAAVNHPHRRSVWVDLVAFYATLGRSEEERGALEEAVDALPHDELFLRNLGDWYFKREKFESAILAYKRLAVVPQMRSRLSSQTDLQQFAISLLLEGKRPGAIQRFLAVTGWELPAVNEYSRKNYLKIARHVHARGIKHVAVQYPTLDVNVLKETLRGAPGIEFVDNQRTFVEALRSRPYEALFTDRFAGSFGHMTEDGNDLLAAQIEATVLPMVKEILKASANGPSKTER